MFAHHKHNNLVASLIVQVPSFGQMPLKIAAVALGVECQLLKTRKGTCCGKTFICGILVWAWSLYVQWYFILDA